MNTSTEIGGIIDLEMKKMHTAMIRISTMSALYTSAALTAALTQRWFQTLFALFGIYNIYVFSEDYVTLPSFGRQEALLFQFTPLELRGGGSSDVPVISALGLLLDGCKVDGNEQNPYNLTTSGSSVKLAFARKQVMNGFYFKTLGGTPQLDPVRFKLEGSNDGVNWRAVGGSGTMQVLIRGLPIVGSWSPTTTERLTEQAFDQRATWQNELYSLSATLVYILGFLVVAGLAARGRPERGKSALIATMMSEGTQTLTCAIIFVASGRTLESVDAWLRFAMYYTVSFSLAYREQHIIKDMFLFGVALVLLPWIQAWTYNGSPNSGVTKLAPIGIAITTITLIVAVCRVLLLHKAERTLRGDMEAYNKAWAGILRKDSTQQAVRELADLCQLMRVEQHSLVLRQCNSAATPRHGSFIMAPSAAPQLQLSAFLTLDHESPITSLDQVRKHHMAHHEQLLTQ